MSYLNFSEIQRTTASSNCSAEWRLQTDGTFQRRRLGPGVLDVHGRPGEFELSHLRAAGRLPDAFNGCFTSSFKIADVVPGQSKRNGRGILRQRRADSWTLGRSGRFQPCVPGHVLQS